MKVLIYIVCYNAEKHISSVLNRIPPESRLNSAITMVMVSDDCFADSTATVTMQACSRLDYKNYEIITK